MMFDGTSTKWIICYLLAASGFHPLLSSTLSTSCTVCSSPLRPHYKDLEEDEPHRKIAIKTKYRQIFLKKSRYTVYSTCTVQSDEWGEPEPYQLLRRPGRRRGHTNTEEADETSWDANSCLWSHFEPNFHCMCLHFVFHYIYRHTLCETSPLWHVINIKLALWLRWTSWNGVGKNI